jgi:hypothetical protein
MNTFGKDKKLTPHYFNTKIELPRTKSGQAPSVEVKVLVEKKAYELMCAYVDICPLEIWWCGTVVRTGDSFLVEEVFVPHQEVSPVTAALRHEGPSISSAFIMEHGFDKVKKLKLFGHSHVHMDTFISGTDATNLAKCFQGKPWLLWLTCNKRGRAEFTVCLRDGEQEVIIRDAAWAVVENGKELSTEELANCAEDSEVRKMVAAQIKERVQAKGSGEKPFRLSIMGDRT